jgi:hypothetical protein
MKDNVTKKICLHLVFRSSVADIRPHDHDRALKHKKILNYVVKPKLFIPDPAPTLEKCRFRIQIRILTTIRTVFSSVADP